MPKRLLAALLPCLLAPCIALAADDALTAQQWIDRLGPMVRQALEEPRPGQSPEEIERTVARQIDNLNSSPAGQATLVATDDMGRTPLMSAVSGGYLPVVKALLASPAVRATLNQANERGETAWMVANFALPLTLVACQPGALTLDRYPLLRPYLRRMGQLLKAERSVTTSIIQALEAAGAQPEPDAARQAWLARCPNATPALREALAQGPLPTALVNDALARQLAFNKAHRQGDPNIPERPPEGMTFIPVRALSLGQPAPPALDAAAVRCTHVSPPALPGAMDWSGTLQVRTHAATRAGVVEVADFTVLSPGAVAPHVLDFFRRTIVQSLATYQCEGDHVFERDFQFKVQ